MVMIGWKKISVAILRNMAHRVVGGAFRGGHRTVTWTDEQRRGHAEGIYSTLAPYIGDVAGQIGVEIGPGDNLDVCRLFNKSGACRMYAVEKYARPTVESDAIVLIPAQIEEVQLPEPVDFAYSNDVFEHVSDVPQSMKTIFKALRPGGRFVNSVDLRGHNVFSKAGRDLDFLTCPDWLWSLMFSHIVTTNRVRAHEFHEAAEAAGFRVLKVEALAAAPTEYIAEVRPHMLPRYRSLPDEDLRVLQLLLVLERPL